MVDEYIRKQDAIDAARESGKKIPTVAIRIMHDIKAIPAADVAPVVRCKDCKHSEHWYRDKRRCFLWAEDGIDVFDDGFCSYGERKEKET